MKGLEIFSFRSKLEHVKTFVELLPGLTVFFFIIMHENTFSGINVTVRRRKNTIRKLQEENKI